MKILQLINSLYAGGAEKLLVDATIEYHKMGLSVDILLLHSTDSPFRQKLEDYPEIVVHSIGHNINVYNPILIFRLKEFFDQYDIVHVHLFPSLYWASLAKFLKLTGKPLILTEHSTNNNRRNSPIWRTIDRFVYKQFAHIITISDAAFKSLQKHLGRHYNNIITVENGVDLDAINNAKPYNKTKFGLNENDFLLIQISSFRYPKDQKTVIKALKILDDNTHLILVGDGPLKEENMELARELDISDKVHFLGIRNDVPKLLKSADIAILSSIYEGLSLSSIEGMASGIPFIATEVPGLTDVVKNAGILVPSKNEVEMAAEIKKLKEDVNYYDEIVKRCLERSKKYDIKKMAANYYNLYKKVFNKK